MTITLKRVFGLLIALSLSLAQIEADRNQAPVNPLRKSDNQKLDLITIGEEVMSTGRRGAFRVYAAPDGTKAIVSYVRFESAAQGDLQIEQWLKLARKIQSREEKKDQDGQVIGERIVAVGGADAKRKTFLIIRRVRLTCYFVRSVSLPVAMEVEDLIEE